MGTFDPLSTFVQLSDGPEAFQLPLTSTFWEELGERSDLQGGRLVSSYRFTEDWQSWERHPLGDELVIQINGAMDFELERANGERYTIELRGRAAVLVPRGEWHIARVFEPSEAIFVTRGAGTEHRPL